ncbi:MAG: hypothetical protein H6636_07010 [Anaerolineales bacterium]|nr:hypothetical protein [Anaerolineales bacterium]
MSMNGSNLLILANVGTPEVPAYQVVGCQRGATIDEQTAEIDASCKSSRNKRVLPGRYSSTIALDGLYVPNDAAFQALRDANRNGELLLIAREEFGEVLETANCLVTAMPQAFPDQDVATISVSLTVDDGWTVVGS